jgi:hypothetical protein
MQNKPYGLKKNISLHKTTLKKKEKKNHRYFNLVA